ncbi:MAG: fatty acid desaturase [Chloroflexi bacterium]|nr:fatty acid desaturase [Chloroflexota bacterium]
MTTTAATRTWEPLSDVRKRLRVKWYRSPIDKPTLWELMERSDRKGLTHALGHLGLLVALGALTAVAFEQGWWAVFGVALWFYGAVIAFLHAATHELAHGTVFRTPALNRFFMRLFSVVGWWNYNEYRMSHTYHHRYTLFPAGDREVLLPMEASLHPLLLLEMCTVNVRGMFRMLRSVVLMALGRFDMQTVSSYSGVHTTQWTSALSEVHPETYRAAVRFARFLLLFHGGVIVLSIVLQLWWLMILLSGGFFVANAWLYAVAKTQHAGLRDNVPDYRLCVRSIKLDPLSSFLYWHMEHHIEHHMFAGVPCYNLKQLGREVATDYPAPRSLLGAWREMRAAWKRQQTHPGYQFDTPLPATARPAMTSEAAVVGLPAPPEGTADMAASIGALDPEEDRVRV